MTFKTFQFTAAVRGFHYYKRFWNPEPEETLNCSHELNNPFDFFAIKVCSISNDEIVGHLPMEISRVTKFLIDRGAKVTTTLTSTNYRRSPLVQGGLEISCLVKVTMSGTVFNQLLMERYKQIVCERYIEPKDEEIIGTFLHVNVPTDDIVVDDIPVEPKKKKKKSTNNDSVVKTADIRDFFAGKIQKKKTTRETKSHLSKQDEDIVVIDD